MSSLISVVIPAFNEERNIVRALESLIGQSCPGGFEVLVVDNGSADRTMAAAKGFEARLPLRVLQKTDVTISGVRNFGAGCATGEILAFIDSDCMAPAGWLTRVEQLTPEPKVITGSAYLPPPGANWLARAWAGHQRRNNRGIVDYVPGGTLIVRRADFLAWKGFDPALATNEDVDLCHRARLAGGRVLAHDELGVYHLGTPSALGHFFRKQKWHGKHVARVFWSTLPRPVNTGAVAFAMWSLFFTVAACVAALWAVLEGPVWPLFAAAAALFAPPLLLSLQSVRRSRAWADLPALWVLFLVYGWARAASLFSSFSRARTSR